MKPHLLTLLLAFTLVFAACGSDSDDEATDADTEAESDSSAEDETSTTEAETTTTEAETTTTEAEAEPEAEEEAETEEAAAPEGSIAIELGEWYISEPGDLTAGSFTFALTNVGENPHTLAIARGTNYEDLPLLDNGAVDTDALGEDYLGTTAENIESGGTGSIDFELEAGDYVFFCPIQFGPNSHAAAGQVLSVTVG